MGVHTPDAGGRKLVVLGVLAPDCVGSTEALHRRPLRARDRPRRTSWGTQPQVLRRACTACPGPDGLARVLKHPPRA